MATVGRLVVAVLLGFLAAAPGAVAQDRVIRATVSKVVDGDSLELSGITRQIRLWGLDAPEWDEKGGPRATRYLEELAFGRRLSCTIRDIDKYDRFIARCELTGGPDIAADMIAAGVAEEYCYFSGNYYGTCAR